MLAVRNSVTPVYCRILITFHFVTQALWIVKLQWVNEISLWVRNQSIDTLTGCVSKKIVSFQFNSLNWSSEVIPPKQNRVITHSPLNECYREKKWSMKREALCFLFVLFVISFAFAQQHQQAQGSAATIRTPKKTIVRCLALTQRKWAKCLVV